VEGYVDAIMVYQAGFENVAATSGTALTNYQLDILKRYTDNLFTAFDMDIAGDSATKRGIDLAQTLGFNIKIITMPKNPDIPEALFKDPAEVILKDQKIWEDCVKKAKTIHDFYFENALYKFDKNTIEGKKQISKALLPIIKKIPNKIEQSLWIQDLARILNIKEEDIAEELKKVKIEERDLENKPEVLSPKIALEQKTRKELLEEYLTALLLKSPKTIGLIKEEDFCLFSSPFSPVINYIKNGCPALDDSQKDFADLFNYLSLRAEILDLEPGLDIETEFNRCFKEIKMLDIKNKLDNICFKIKKAEEEKDFEKLQNLMEEFNLLSRSRLELETS
jgi:DNA primase